MNTVENKKVKVNKLVLIVWCIILYSFGGDMSNVVRAEGHGRPINRPVVIKGEFNYPPYEYINELGEPDGFNVEIIEAIMQKLNLPYTLTLEPWSQVIDELRQGKIDLVTGMMYTDERAGEFNFGAIHNHMLLSIISRKNSRPVTDISELKNKQIIVLKKDITQEILEQAGFSDELILVENLSEGLLMLSKGKYDCAVASLEMVRAVIRRYGITNLTLNSLTDLPIKEYCFAGNNDSLLSMVNRAFYAIKEDGTYDNIYDKWFVPIGKAYIPTFVYLIVAALIFALLVFIIFVRLLRRQVKKSNRKLELTSRKLALALSADNMAVWGCDVCRGVLYNIRGRAFPDGGIKKETGVEFIHPDDQETFNILFEKVIKGEDPDAAISFRFKDAHTSGWLYIETKLAVIRSASGKVETVIGTHKDVTNEVFRQKREEQFLKKYRTVFNSTLVGLEYYDQDGILMDINDTICTIFGIEDKEAILKKHLSIYDNPNLKHLVSRDRALDTSCSIIEYDFNELAKTDYYSFTSQKGHFSIEVRILPIYTAEGALDCIITTAIDVTETQRLQKALRGNIRKTKLVIQATNMVLWEFDCLTKTFKCYNDPVNHYDETRFLTLEDYSNCFHPDDLSKVVDDVHQMLTGNGEYIPAIDARMKYPDDNSWHFCTIHGTPLEHEPKTGRIIKYAGFRRDNTEMLLAQLNLEKEKEKAQQADKLKSVFLANMSHEIRTPLNAVVGFSSLLHEVESEEERTNFIEIIKANSDLLLRLINDILDLSKIEAGAMQFSYEAFDIVPFFDALATSTRQRMVNPDVEFIAENPYETCVIYFDCNRLAQVYTNFITNAIKYVSKGHIKVGYKYENNGIRIYVEDTGIGIATSKQHLVFLRFEKLDDFAQGTGLGLSICKAIVDATQGEIGFTSEEGRGSTFWAWFPCQVEAKS